MLDNLTKSGLKLTIFSNKPHNFTVDNVSGLLGRWKFAVALGVSESTPKKPDSTAPRRIARELKLSTADFVYLGDSGTDMRTAVAAGMYPVGALWGFRTADDLKAGGARELVAYPTDLLNLLELTVY
jgi:phosphoglycolate phosphatase